MGMAEGETYLTMSKENKSLIFKMLNLKYGTLKEKMHVVSSFYVSGKYKGENRNGLINL